MQKLSKEYLSTIERKHVLALDVAIHTGYYSIYDYGVWHFPSNGSRDAKSRDESYAQHKVFRATLIDYIVAHDIRVVVAEDVIYAHFMDFRKLCELRGVLLEVCETMDIPIVMFKPSDIKKFATGNGNAKKDDMVIAAIKKWKIDPQDDNVADSAHIFFYFCKRYKL